MPGRRRAKTGPKLWLESLEQRVLFDAGGLPFRDLYSADDVAAGEATSTVASVQIPLAPVRKLDVVFSRPMAIEPLITDGSIRSAVSIVAYESGSLDLSKSTFAYNSTTQTLTWTSATMLTPGLYELRLDGAVLQDTDGNPLHGGTGGLVFALPVFAASQNVQVGSTAIDVDSYSVPAIADWNADGVRDLIVGEKTTSGAGKIRIYLNTGTADAPAFETFFYAQQEGQDLSVAGSGCLGAFPRVFDWDRDGKKDLLVGLADGRVQIFPNVNTDAAPIFGAPSFVKVGQTGAKTELDVGARATPEIIDWNNDGREDLVMGALDGKVRVLLDQAPLGDPDFSSELVIRDGTIDLAVASGRSSVAVADLNRDGRKDLLLGNTDGQLFFYPNVGTDRAPAFAGSEAIAADGVTVDLPGSPRSRPFVGSIHAAGLPDLWVGEEQGLIQHFVVTSWPSPTSAPIQDGTPGGTFAYRFEVTISVWQNPESRLDVSADGHIVPGDVLMIINELNHPTCHDQSGLLQSPPPPGTAPPYYDTNGDGYCTPIDVLNIINYLNSQPGAGEGEATGTSLGEAIRTARGDSLAFFVTTQREQTDSTPQRDRALSRGAEDELSLITTVAVEYSASRATAGSPPADTAGLLAVDVSLGTEDLESLLALLAADRARGEL